MEKDLSNAGILNTPVNNQLIINKVLDSAKDVTSISNRTSTVIQGPDGSVRVYATWKVLPDGTKRLTTVQTGAFKE